MKATRTVLPLELVTPPLPHERDPFVVYLRGLSSAESRRAMRRCLNTIAAIYLADAGQAAGEGGLAAGDRAAAADPAELRGAGRSRAWWQLRYEDTARIRTLIVERGFAPATTSQHLAALRRVLKECRRLGLMTADEYERATDLDPVRGSRLPAGRDIAEDEMSALLRRCVQAEEADGPIAIRDAAMFAVMMSTGIRREEASSALIQAWNASTRALRVVGKGDKQRTVYVHPSAVEYLNWWLALLNGRSGPMFPPVDRWHNIAGRHMTPRAVGRRIERRRVQAGLPPTSAHDFRHTFAGDFLDAGGDVVSLQKLLGHASPATTSGYDRRPGRGARAVVDQLPMTALAEFQSREPEEEVLQP
jgi:site-specific recombinase XerD